MHKQPPANRLKELRLARGLRHMDIAIACGGVHPSTVKRWEDKVIPQEYFQTVADLLEVDVPYLTGWARNERQAA